MSTLTVILGSVAIASAFDDDLHMLGSWVGMAGTVIGFYAQLISETTAERFVNVIFIGAAFVGWGLNMAHGGFL
jgi:pyruvate/2-oxoglutarate/acetoin dehydrogenase E1 component